MMIAERRLTDDDLDALFDQARMAETAGRTRDALRALIDAVDELLDDLDGAARAVRVDQVRLFQAELMIAAGQSPRRTGA